MVFYYGSYKSMAKAATLQNIHLLNLENSSTDNSPGIGELDIFPQFSHRLWILILRVLLRYWCFGPCINQARVFTFRLHSWTSRLCWILKNISAHVKLAGHGSFTKFHRSTQLVVPIVYLTAKSEWHLYFQPTNHVFFFLYPQTWNALKVLAKHRGRCWRQNTVRGWEK